MMDAQIQKLQAQRDDLLAQINARRDELQDGCEHDKVLETQGSLPGRLFMCADCYVEAHAWTPRGMKATWMRRISWDEFMSRRPPGDLRTLR